jgi:hypothetical protein
MNITEIHEDQLLQNLRDGWEIGAHLQNGQVIVRHA